MIIIAPNEHLHLTGMMFVRAYVRAHVCHTGKMFTSYFVVELSPRAEIWCVYVTSINDGTHILTFPGINYNRDFRRLDFLWGIGFLKI